MTFQVNAAFRLAAALDVHEEARRYLEGVSGLKIAGREVTGQDDMSAFIIKTKDFDKAVANVQKYLGKKPKMTKSRPVVEEPDQYNWKTLEGTVQLQNSLVRTRTGAKATAFIKLLK